MKYLLRGVVTPRLLAALPRGAQCTRGSCSETARRRFCTCSQARESDPECARRRTVGCVHAVTPEVPVLLPDPLAVQVVSGRTAHEPGVLARLPPVRLHVLRGAEEARGLEVGRVGERTSSDCSVSSSLSLVSEASSPKILIASQMSSSRPNPGSQCQQRPYLKIDGSRDAAWRGVVSSLVSVEDAVERAGDGVAASHIVCVMAARDESVARQPGAGRDGAGGHLPAILELLHRLVTKLLVA